ncbi:hypothetical protein [Microcystis sp. M112S1]|uniref:hypothetical protein n=1 Tax=Microcystis sp. M112S1 TaxID=2771103 RepID=UPI002582AD8E|nr:hypothetical protein [Microcystis sp. M112S1]MCA2951911.1 hypothetical protein [Microcystis sp. M112S1]MCA6481234.1 hypothetical protein [Chitinophagaceae bacterium]MCA6518004.1 hypothetical protein [Pseudanabaena sp. M110S1SP2A07QC]
MKHYYDGVPVERLNRRTVDGGVVVIIGEEGLCHIAVEAHDVDEWYRLATSEDIGERVCATMLEFLTPKNKRLWMREEEGFA